MNSDGLVGELDWLHNIVVEVNNRLRNIWRWVLNSLGTINTDKKLATRLGDTDIGSGIVDDCGKA